MSPRTAQTIVVLVGVGLFGYTAIRYLLDNSSAFGRGGVYKQLWAIGAVTLMLTLLADLVPEIAGPFAILVGLAYILAGRGVADLLDAVGAQRPTGDFSGQRRAGPNGGDFAPTVR